MGKLKICYLGISGISFLQKCSSIFDMNFILIAEFDLI